MTLNTSTLVISRLEWSDWELSRSQETVRTNIFQKPSFVRSRAKWTSKLQTVEHVEHIFIYNRAICIASNTRTLNIKGRGLSEFEVV